MGLIILNDKNNFWKWELWVWFHHICPSITTIDLPKPLWRLTDVKLCTHHTVRVSLLSHNHEPSDHNYKVRLKKSCCFFDSEKHDDDVAMAFTSIWLQEHNPSSPTTLLTLHNHPIIKPLRPTHQPKNHPPCYTSTPIHVSDHFYCHHLQHGLAGGLFVSRANNHNLPSPAPTHPIHILPIIAIHKVVCEFCW